MNKCEIIKRLKQLDSDMALLDTSEDVYSCVIVGGSAFVLTDKIYRSTHDIDSITSACRVQHQYERKRIPHEFPG